jgi:hypothetical protein
MAYTVADLYPGIMQALGNKTLADADMNTWIRKAVLELSEDYPFPALQVTGPTVQLTPYQSAYSTSYFTPAQTTIDIEHFDSLWCYIQPPTVLGTSNNNNPGIQLKYKDISNLEVLLNTSGQPTNWTRHEGKLYIAMVPDNNYSIYARYREEHPFSNPAVGTDPILLPNSWQDIVEYCAAYRAAASNRMWDLVTNLKSMIYGDPDFQRSGGIQGAPGLIFRRTSQTRRDQDTTTRAMKLRMGN